MTAHTSGQAVVARSHHQGERSLGTEAALQLCDDDVFDLLTKVRMGDLAARNELVSRNLGLVRLIAVQLKCRQQDDAFQDGVIGLIIAAQRFDAEHYPGVSFGTYAAYWIRERIFSAMSADNTVRVPGGISKLKAAQCKGATLNVHDAAKLRHAQEAWHANGNLDRHEPASLDEDPATTMDHAEDLETLAAGIAALTLAEHEILKARFGLDGQNPEAIDSIARRLGVQIYNIKASERRALDSLRGAFNH